ncbi:MAG: MFS transporter [Paracoccaceae bacterium]
MSAERPTGLVAFARANGPWLGAGALMTFASSFGQTFFIAVFAGGIREEFSLSHAAWGGAYTLGTLASAAVMLQAGALTDRFRARSLALLLVLGFAGVCVFAANVSGWWTLALAIFGLRFCGQGMLTHTAVVSMGRWFAANRGRAIAIANLGIAAGEAILPFLFVLLIGWLGWRGGWLAAAVCLLLIAPFVPRLLRTERTPRSIPEAEHRPGLGGRHWTRREAVSHWLFRLTFPGFLAAPVFSTAFFFQQVHLAEIKGWTLAQFTALFPVYVALAIPASFLGGWAADRFGATRTIFLWPLILAAGLTAAATLNGLWGAVAALALLGVMQGLGSSLTGAFWPEVYGTRNLGAIRAVASSAMVFATALGPGLSGALLDLGVGFEAQLLAMAAYAFAMAGVFLAAGRRIAEERPALPSSAV